MLALPSAVGWVAEHECGSAVSMTSTPRPSAVDADVLEYVSELLGFSVCSVSPPLFLSTSLSLCCCIALCL